MAERTILHIDMDAFFASVEQRDHPELRGKPVLVGGDGRRGVVAAASYEARKFGCHSAMASSVAKRLCPDAIFVKGSHGVYKQVSRQVFEILERFSPAIEPVSIDEAYLDVSGSTHLFGTGLEIAIKIRRLVREELGLTCSVGIAPNKFLAKLASDMNKPDGYTIMTQDTVEEILDPLGVERIMGVGPASQRALERLGIRTIGQLRKCPLESLQAQFGDSGERLYRLSRGIDDRPVRVREGARSISHEHTYENDIEQPDEIRAMIARQSLDVATRLRKHGRFARTISIKIRFGDFQTITRSSTLETQTDETAVIHSTAKALFDRWAKGFRPVRLIGVALTEISETSGDAGLFDTETREINQAIDQTTDLITRRFGKGALTTGATLKAAQAHGLHGPGSESGDRPE
ncbi:MAG: DNA polymerase IV [Phycisphaerales bacterium]|nr:DNA polymerase IV [Phycisphaerales bacterium]